MEISRHINELLFDHDCVIVPSLGGFLASNQPSSVLMPNSIIYPPYRKIAFNVYLKQNDGLLANFIVSSENIAYNEAVNVIEEYVSSCIDLLENGKKVSINGIGTLYFDKEKNIQFDAFRNFNHLKDSFGMEPVQFTPIQKGIIREKKEAPVRIRPSISSKEKISSGTTFKKSGRIIGVIAFGAAAIWFSLNLYLVAPKKYESTSLSPFDSQEIVISKTDSIRNVPSSTEIKTEDSSLVSPAATTTIPDETTASIETPVKSEPVVTEPEEEIVNKTLPEIKTEVSPTALSVKHYVIAGVFKIRENALSLRAQLQQSGFPEASVIEANHMTYVSFNGFSSAEEALKLTDSLQAQKLEGWVWKH